MAEVSTPIKPNGSTVSTRKGSVVQPEPTFSLTRGASLAQPSDFKSALKSGHALFSLGALIPSAECARIVGSLGSDFVFLDAEHTPMSPELLVQMIRNVALASEGSSAAVVRLPGPHSPYCSYALDAGAAGVILPHTETAEQVPRALEAGADPNRLAPSSQVVASAPRTAATARSHL